MNTLRLYIHSMAMLLKSHLQYPASFIMQTIAQLVMEGGEILAVPAEHGAPNREDTDKRTEKLTTLAKALPEDPYALIFGGQYPPL